MFNKKYFYFHSEAPEFASMRCVIISLFRNKTCRFLKASSGNRLRTSSLSTVPLTSHPIKNTDVQEVVKGTVP